MSVLSFQHFFSFRFPRLLAAVVRWFWRLRPRLVADYSLLWLGLSLGLLLFFASLLRPACALTLVSVPNLAAWQQVWDQLDPDLDISGRHWQVEDSFTIKEGFRNKGSSYWEVGADHTLGWDNALLDEPVDQGHVYKFGTGRLSLASTGRLRGDVNLLEGSLRLERADAVNYSTQLYTYANTRLEYGAGIEVWANLHAEPTAHFCGQIACPNTAGTGPYADGLQWHVAQGEASQHGLIFSQIPLYKTGQGVLYLAHPLVANTIQHDFHIVEGGLRLNSSTGAPLHVHPTARLIIKQAQVHNLYVRPGGILEVGQRPTGPGLRVHFDLVLEAGSTTYLQRSSQQPDQALITTLAQANTELAGSLQLQLTGDGWDPNQRYALIDTQGSYSGQYDHTHIDGNTPKGYQGQIEYDANGLWLAFSKQQKQQSNPTKLALPYAPLRKSLILSSHHLPEAVRQYYTHQTATKKGLSGWAWSGGARQRSTDHRLHYQMNYLGLHWQSDHADQHPLNLGLQIGFEQGDWQQKQAKTDINSWLIGLSLQQQQPSGWQWHVGLAHHRYNLKNQRQAKQQRHHSRYTTQLNQIYGQIGYALNTSTEQYHWQITPIARLRWLQLHSPSHKETTTESSNNPLRIKKTTDKIAEIALGLQSQWTLNHSAQPTRLHSSISYHQWLGHKKLKTTYTKGNQSQNSPTTATLQPHTAWQFGIEHQPHKHWRIEINAQGRLGKGLRDNAVGMMVEGRF